MKTIIKKLSVVCVCFIIFACGGGSSDEMTEVYLDSDSDGYGSTEPKEVSMQSVTDAAGAPIVIEEKEYVTNQSDCNDSDAAVNPNIAEVAGDNVDNDCDGAIDEVGAELTVNTDNTNITDTDDDGDGVTENQGDCNDGNTAINTSATEICGDSIDNNCDGSLDEDCVSGNDDGIEGTASESFVLWRGIEEIAYADQTPRSLALLKAGLFFQNSEQKSWVANLATLKNGVSNINAKLPWLKVKYNPNYVKITELEFDASSKNATASGIIDMSSYLESDKYDKVAFLLSGIEYTGNQSAQIKEIKFWVEADSYNTDSARYTISVESNQRVVSDDPLFDYKISFQIIQYNSKFVTSYNVPYVSGEQQTTYVGATHYIDNQSIILPSIPDSSVIVGLNSIGFETNDFIPISRIGAFVEKNQGESSFSIKGSVYGAEGDYYEPNGTSATVIACKNESVCVIDSSGTKQIIHAGGEY